MSVVTQEEIAGFRYGPAHLEYREQVMDTTSTEGSHNHHRRSNCHDVLLLPKMPSAALSLGRTWAKGVVCSWVSENCTKRIPKCLSLLRSLSRSLSLSLFSKSLPRSSSASLLAFLRGQTATCKELCQQLALGFHFQDPLSPGQAHLLSTDAALAEIQLPSRAHLQQAGHHPVTSLALATQAPATLNPKP